MNSSKEKPFSSSELEALGLWDVAEQFGKKKKPAVVQPKKEKATLTVDDIEKMQQQAYDEAFAQGKKQGFDDGFKEGTAKGYDEGFVKGKVEGEKKGYDDNLHLIQKETAAFVSLLESLNEPFKELDEAVETELVNLAIGIASQIVRREIKIDPGQIVAVIREAVNALPLASQKLTLQMHPEDAELLKKSLALDDMTAPWNIVEDPLVTRGGCVVKTETSHIDTTIENRLAVIVATVLGGERDEDQTE